MQKKYENRKSERDERGGEKEKKKRGREKFHD